MKGMPLFVSIDFDGTITEEDVTDAVIREFAATGWEGAEDLWEKGLIGSRECLARQVNLIDAPLDTVLDFVDTFAIEQSFIGFVDFLERHRIPFGILSDGFKIFIERILHNAGLKVPVYASQLVEKNGRIKTLFPFSSDSCPSGLCKCTVARDLSGGLPVVHIGDGRSDFCLADKADFVFAKARLADFCEENLLPYRSFDTFRGMEEHITTSSLATVTTAGDFMKSLRGR